MKTPELLKKAFEDWKLKKDIKLLKLYQEKSTKEAKGEYSDLISEQINKSEQEIVQRKARLEKELARLYEQIYRSGASADAKKARQERTHHLCNLGGLVEKAGLGELDKATLLGMLLQQAEYLANNPSIKARWAERGKTAFDEMENEKSEG